MRMDQLINGFVAFLHGAKTAKTTARSSSPQMARIIEKCAAAIWSVPRFVYMAPQDEPAAHGDGPKLDVEPKTVFVGECHTDASPRELLGARRVLVLLHDECVVALAGSLITYRIAARYRLHEVVSKV